MGTNRSAGSPRSLAVAPACALPAVGGVPTCGSGPTARLAFVVRELRAAARRGGARRAAARQRARHEQRGEQR
jgi:hypothetical protein